MFEKPRKELGVPSPSNMGPQTAYVRWFHDNITISALITPELSALVTNEQKRFLNGKGYLTVRQTANTNLLHEWRVADERCYYVWFNCLTCL